MKFIVCLLLVSVYVSQGHAMYNDASTIEANAHRNIDETRQRIQNKIREQREKSEATRKRIEDEAKAAGTYTSSSISSSSSSSSGEPGTSYTSYISSSNSPSGTSSSHSHGTSSSSSTVNGVTTTVRNGIDSNGNAYSTETTEKKVNGAVHRTVKTWNSETQTYDVSRYIVYPNQKAVAVDSFDNE